MRPAFAILPLLAAGCVLAGAALTPAALAAEAGSGASAPTVKRLGASLTTTGTITAIDTANRHLTVRGTDGTEHTYAVGSSVHLERAKVGDLVKVDYSVAVAMSLKKGGGSAREKIEAASATRNPAPQHPGVQATSRTTIVADVVEIDRKTQIARLKGPEGRVEDVKVRDPKVLAEVKPGDQVVADVTEEMAIQLHPAPAGAASAASGM
jgi:hypothetical protein